MEKQTIDVGRLCELANVEMTPEEAAECKKQLEVVVGYVRKVAEVDVSGVEPTVYGQAAKGAFREDVRVPEMSRETALANAPERINNEFKVPRIVE